MVAGALPAVAQTASLMSEAQRAYLAGDLQIAKTNFTIILSQDPQNKVAANYLRMIAAAEARTGSSGVAEKQLQKVIVSVELKEATLDSALSYLKDQADKASQGKVKPNFVLAPGVDRKALVTLRLSSLPLTDALRYMCSLVNARFTVDRYAITLRPLGEAPAASAGR